MKLTKLETSALHFLAAVGGGFTSSAIADHCGRARDRIDMAGFRSAVMMRLLRDGLVDKIDAETPVVFVITDAGRAALSLEQGEKP